MNAMPVRRKRALHRHRKGGNMDSLSNVVVLLFQDVSSKDILSGRVKHNCFDEKTFKELVLNYNTKYTSNEAENLYSYIQDELSAEEIMQDGYAQRQGKGINIWRILKKFDELTLKEIEEIPVCRYRYLLKWREVSHVLGEELFTNSFLAYRDWKFRRISRGKFDWKDVIGSDNVELNNMLSRGLADNHFHLKGSAPYFYMSWINMMNQVNKKEFVKRLQYYDNNRQTGMAVYHGDAAEEPLAILCLQAALIRAYLYTWIRNIPFFIQNDLYVPFEQIKDVIEWAQDGTEPNRVEVGKLCSYKGKVWADDIIWNYCLDSGQLQNKRQWKWICDCLLRGIRFEELAIQELVQDTISEKQLMEVCFKRGKMVRITPDFIRLFIQGKHQEEMTKWAALCNVEKLLRDNASLEMKQRKLQNVIDTLRIEGRTPYEGKKLDYMQTESGSGEDSLYGERWFLYTMFQKLYARDYEAECRGNLFYAYLVIKGRIRSELIQVNDRVGFDNFLQYQNRKEEFIEGTGWDKVYSKYAVVNSFKGQPLRTLELRITPRKTARQNSKYIEKLDKQILDNKNGVNNKFSDGSPISRDDYFYVFHFVKEPEKKGIPNSFECRHVKLREKVREQAIGIYGMREKYVEQAERVYGIDACSPEIGCRPEIFAQAFRFLKNEQNFMEGIEPEKRRPRLRTTYHVGEDFLDIVDGMRAIDEAIYFLNMTHGDRLGHALALGVLPREWYGFKDNRVLCTKQDILDNIVWIHQKIRKYEIKDTEAILMKLQREYVHLYQEVYRSGRNREKENLDIALYYDAWKLRGDNPILYYQEGKIEEQSELSRWNRYNKNLKYGELDKIRSQESCREIYYRYHYDEEVKRAGAVVIEQKITQDIINVAEQIQYCMQKEIMEKGIAIETNPSSNYLISTFRAYEKHPIIHWHNKGLTNDIGQLDECPQLDVTINTDDQSVFGTSLENEYALMAIALEKAVDDDGNPMYKKDMIYDWLDEIREKGFTRCFRQRIR